VAPLSGWALGAHHTRLPRPIPYKDMMIIEFILDSGGAMHAAGVWLRVLTESLLLGGHQQEQETLHCMA
jgi:hypothetical protein